MSSKPNILLILSDQHSRRIAGCYGDPVIETPNIDRLASTGTLFENAYCSFPLCCPSRMSFMTGREPHDINIFGNGNLLASDLPTFAHALGHGGYETLLCGRMDFVGYDQRHGFQRRVFPEFRGTPAMAGLEGTNQMQRVSLEKSGPGRNPFLLYDEECVNAAVEFLHQRHANVGTAPRTMTPSPDAVRDADPTKPFLLVAGLVGPHCPFICPPDLFHKYHDRVTLPPLPDQSTLHPFHQRYRTRSRIEDLTPVEIRRTRAAYYGMVDFLDTLVGRLVGAVDTLGLRENTIIIYASDHGEAAGEHGLWWKTSLYEDSVGVPLIVSWPGRIPSAQRNRTLVSLLDLAPTLTALSDSPSIPEVSGHGFADILRDSAFIPDRAVCSQIISTDRQSVGPGKAMARMIRRGDWKANYYHGEPPELFNLADDPGELHNRAADPACKEILAQLLSQALATWNPAHISARMQQKQTLVDFVRQAPGDASVLAGEYWPGPPGYGFVDPTCAMRE